MRKQRRLRSCALERGYPVLVDMEPPSLVIFPRGWCRLGQSERGKVGLARLGSANDTVNHHPLQLSNHLNPDGCSAWQRTRNDQPPVLCNKRGYEYQVGIIRSDASFSFHPLSAILCPYSPGPQQPITGRQRTDSLQRTAALLTLAVRSTLHTHANMRSILYAQLASTAFAFPLFHRRSPVPAASYNVVSVDGHDSAAPELQPRAPHPKADSPSYSVVAVDGANSPSPAPPAATETIITTRLSTLIVTADETPQSVVVTITEPAANTPTPAAPAQPDATVTQTVTPPEDNSPQAQAGQTQTRAYDNGMWHTTYYYTTVIPPQSSPTPAAPAPSSSPAAAAPAAVPVQGDDVKSNDDAPPSNDAAPDLEGTQLVGGPPPIDAGIQTDADRQAWLEGQWAPWNKGQVQNQNQAEGENEGPSQGQSQGQGQGRQGSQRGGAGPS